MKYKVKLNLILEVIHRNIIENIDEEVESLLTPMLTQIASSSTELSQPLAQAKRTKKNNPAAKHKQAFHQMIRGPNTQMVFEIASKYINSPLQAWAFVNALESIPANGIITYNAAVKNFNSKARPDNTSKHLLLQELHDSDLFKITYSNIRINIEKGNLYQ